MGWHHTFPPYYPPPPPHPWTTLQRIPPSDDVLPGTIALERCEAAIAAFLVVTNRLERGRARRACAAVTA
jgi:hypothetical protein